MIYRVSGRQKFLGYAPGETFVAELDSGVEERAIARGSIEIVEEAEVALDATRASLPRGWIPKSSSRSRGKNQEGLT